QSGGLAVVTTVTAGNDPWNIAAVAYDFGDGTAVVNTPNASWRHVYSQPGTYQVTATVTDATGAHKSVACSFTTAGTAYTASGPTRALNRVSTPVPAHTAVTVAIAGVGGIPAGVAAAAVNLTAVNPSASGTLTAWADGASRPGTTNVRFATGQTT